jgi:hypothetical protein
MLNFNSSGDFLTAANTAAQQITGDLTVGIKLNPSAFPGSESADWALFISDIGELETQNVLYGVGLRNNGGTTYWSYFHESGAGNNYRVDTTITPAGVGIEQTVVVVRDTTAKTVRFIVDGVDEGAFGYAANPTGGSATGLIVGKSDTAGQEWNGDIGHIAIWNTALSTVNAQKYHGATNSGLDDLSSLVVDIDWTNLVSYYPMAGEGPEKDFKNTVVLDKWGSPTLVASLTSPFTSPNIGSNSRQGYATDGTYHYVSDNAALYKRNDDGTWSVALSNTSPFASLPGTLNHIGDISEYSGILYAGVNNFTSCATNSNHQIVKYNASDLTYNAHVVVADSVGVAAVAVDGPGDRVYTASYCDGTTIWVYDLSLVAVTTITLSITLPTIQGLTFKNGWLYALTTTGTLFIINPSNGRVVWGENVGGGYVEYEGIDYSQSTLRYLTHESGSTYTVHYLSGVPAAAGGLTLIGKNLDARWGMLNNAGNQANVQWAIVNAVQQSTDLQWGILNAAGKSVDLQHAILNAVGKSSDIRWDILSALASVGKSLDARWDILTTASKSIDAQWSILNTVFKDADLRYSLLEAVAKDVDLRWDLLSSISTVGTGIDLQWSILATVSRSLDSQWGILGSVGADTDMRWEILKAVSNDADLQWALLQSAGKQVDIRWDQLATTGKDISLRWSVLSDSSFPDITGTITINSITPIITVH